MEAEGKTDSCNRCEVCKGTLENNVSNLAICNPVEKCKDWLENNSTEDVISVCSETTTGSVFTEQTDNSAMDSGYVFTDDGVVLEDRICTYQNNVRITIK